MSIAEGEFYFVEEIQAMMFGYGDSMNPCRQSAQMIEDIVLQQMHSLLIQLADIAKIRRRKAPFDHELILFLMRRNRVKLHRLLKYMEFKDIKASVCSNCSKDEAPVEEMKSELDINPRIEPKQKPNSRVSKCVEFLRMIDQTGALYDVLNDDRIFDEEKQARLVRHNKISLALTSADYLQYEEARRVSFVCTSRPIHKFEHWLLQNSPIKQRPTKLALEMIAYLAHETVAKIVDLCLVLKEERNKIYVAQQYAELLSTEQSKTSQSTSTGIGKNIDGCGNKMEEEKNPRYISPNDIWEVLRQFYQPRVFFLNTDYKENTEQRLFCC